MKKILFSLLMLPGVLLNSCNNDLDIVDPGEEVIIIYALLNTNDSVQYIKVNKGFASQDKSPLVLAQDPDQLFFDSLIVELTDLDFGHTGTIEKVSMSKDPGDFTQAVNYLYRSTLPVYKGGRYRVVVRNPISGKQAESEIRLLGAPDPKSPNSININTYPIEPGRQFTVNLEADPLAHIYEIRIHFIYEEYNSLTGSTETKTATWNFGSGKFNDQRKLLIRTEGSLFYNFLATTIPQKGPEITRRGKSLQFEYWTADREMATYLDVYGSSSIGVVQKKTDYTNIIGGFGLFAGRNRLLVTGTNLGSEIRNQLTTNPQLTPLKFVD